MSGANFSTITEKAIAASATGVPRGERGRETQAAIVRAERLAAKRPWENDKLATGLLAQRHGVWLLSRPTSKAGWSRWMARSLSKPWPDQWELEESLQTLRFMMTPATSEQIVAALGELAAFTVQRATSEHISDGMLQMWERKLQEYPADVALSAIRRYLEGDNARWWPAWADIAVICERLVRDRRDMIAALELALTEADRAEELERLEWIARNDPVRREEYAAKAAALRELIGGEHYIKEQGQ